MTIGVTDDQCQACDSYDSGVREADEIFVAHVKRPWNVGLSPLNDGSMRALPCRQRRLTYKA